MISEKDEKIIRLLKKDSRLSVREIAKKTGLRPSTVHSRIKKLKAEGTIERFTVKLSKREKKFIVFVLVNTSGKIPADFFRNDNIMEVFGITGEYDLLMKCRFRDVEEFNKFILEFRNLPQISKTITMVGTIEIKEEF